MKTGSAVDEDPIDCDDCSYSRRNSAKRRGGIFIESIAAALLGRIAKGVEIQVIHKWYAREKYASEKYASEKYANKKYASERSDCCVATRKDL